MNEQDRGSQRDVPLGSPSTGEDARRLGGAQPRGSPWGGFGSLALVVALCVAIGGLAFAAGRLTAPTASRAAAFGGVGGRVVGRPNPASSGAPFDGGVRSVVLRGTVLGVTDGRLTIELGSGATVEVDLGAATTVHRQAAASPNDLMTGSSVLVELSGGGGPGTQGGSSTGASASPGASGERRLGTATDITILAP